MEHNKMNTCSQLTIKEIHADSLKNTEATTPPHTKLLRVSGVKQTEVQRGTVFQLQAPGLFVSFFLA